MRKRARIWSAALSLPILAALALPALADHDHDRGHDHDRDRHDHDGDRREHHSFHGRDFSLFTTFELGLWRGGGWRHDWHDGRFGWWWEVDGYWYWYPEPIYPYPTYVPPAAPVAMAPPPPPPPAPGVAPTQFWYYCQPAKAYYPYVSSCSIPWEQVPANPPR